MVRIVNEAIRNNHGFKRKAPFLLELVGLAGAGKTTLSRVLSQSQRNIQVGGDIELRNIEQLPTFITNLPFLLPILFRHYRHGRWFTWDEIKSIVYLKGWPRILRQRVSNNGAIILLDHGPIFKLATLNAFGPEWIKNRGFEVWWNKMFEQWALTLDIIVWLDAAEEILVERINRRNQQHAVKGKSKQEASQFLTRYRASYEHILANLTSFRGPTLLRFDTSKASIDEIADELVVACEAKLRGS